MSLRLLCDSELLIQQLIIGALTIAAAAIKSPCSAIAGAQLQLHPGTATIGKAALRCIQKRDADSLGARLRHHEKFIDLSHESLVLKTEYKNSDEIADEPATRARGPKSAQVPLREQLLQ